MTHLTDRQLAMLHAPLDKGRVQFLQGNSHLEQWDVRRHLIRVFGFTGWGVETLELACVATNSVQDGNRWKHTVVYRAQVRLTVKDTEGNIIAQWEDGAGGDAINQPHLGDAHDLAMKTALSQALKRCAVNLGDQFGLSLYNGGDPRPVVNWSVAYPKPEPIVPDPPVQREPDAAQVDAELDRRIEQAAGHLDPNAVVADAQRRSVPQAIDDADDMDGDSKLTTAELEYAAANGPDEISSRAMHELSRRNQQATPYTTELAQTYAEMCALAARLNFGEQLPAQFRQSFNVDIMQGSVDQYRQAIDLMKASQA